MLMGLGSLGFIAQTLISSFFFSIAHIYAGVVWSIMSFIDGIVYSYAIIEQKAY